MLSYTSNLYLAAAQYNAEEQLGRKNTLEKFPEGRLTFINLSENMFSNALECSCTCKCLVHVTRKELIANKKCCFFFLHVVDLIIYMTSLHDKIIYMTSCRLWMSFRRSFVHLDCSYRMISNYPNS